LTARKMVNVGSIAHTLLLPAIVIDSTIAIRIVRQSATGIHPRINNDKYNTRITLPGEYPYSGNRYGDLLYEARADMGARCLSRVYTRCNET